MRLSFAPPAAAFALAAAAALAEGRTEVAGLAFPEGPAVQGDRLLLAQYGAQVVSAWDGTALTALWAEEGCGPSAVAPLGADLLVTCYDGGSLARVAADGRLVARYGRDDRGEPLVGPNDLAPDGAGGLWVTASGPWESAPIVGKVYHLAPDGSLVFVMALDDPANPPYPGRVLALPME